MRDFMRKQKKQIIINIKNVNNLFAPQAFPFRGLR